MIEYRPNRKSLSYRFSFSVDGVWTARDAVKQLRETVSRCNVNNPNKQRVVVRWREPIGDGYYDPCGNLIGGEKCARRGDVYVYDRD